MSIFNGENADIAYTSSAINQTSQAVKSMTNTQMAIDFVMKLDSLHLVTEDEN